MISSLKANTLDNEKQTQSYIIDSAWDSVLLHRVRQLGQQGGDAGGGELCADEGHGADAEALPDEEALGDRERSGRGGRFFYRERTITGNFRPWRSSTRLKG